MKKLLSVISVLLIAISFNACQKDVPVLSYQQQHIANLKKANTEPFDKVSDVLYQKLLTNSIYDENGIFRGFKDIPEMKIELSSAEFSLLIGKISKTITVETTLQEYEYKNQNFKGTQCCNDKVPLPKSGCGNQYDCHCLF